MRRICDLAGLTFAAETYATEAEMLAARPEWTPAHIELEVDHPVEADIRDFGMSLWWGTGIAVLLSGATGMQLIFATPVKYVVFTACGGRPHRGHRDHHLEQDPLEEAKDAASAPGHRSGQPVVRPSVLDRPIFFQC